MWWLYVLGGLAVLVVGFVALVATRPNDFKIVRSAALIAPQADVFAQVNDLHLWEEWSPWAKKDPTMKQVYDGPQTGVGSSYYWNGNKDVGEGRMTVTESTPVERVRLRLEFIRPFAGVNDVEFTFAPDGGKTLVTWTMTGKFNFITKAFCLFFNMDKMIGTDFEKGLAGIKSKVEK
jgi:hypothetical protein